MRTSQTEHWPGRNDASPVTHDTLYLVTRPAMATFMTAGSVGRRTVSRKIKLGARKAIGPPVVLAHMWETRIGRNDLKRAYIRAIAKFLQWLAGSDEEPDPVTDINAHRSHRQ
jgi:hypothetical protein